VDLGDFYDTEIEKKPQYLSSNTRDNTLFSGTWKTTVTVSLWMISFAGHRMISFAGHIMISFAGHIMISFAGHIMISFAGHRMISRGEAARNLLDHWIVSYG
jgi:hypothetical protein